MVLLLNGFTLKSLCCCKLGPSAKDPKIGLILKVTLVLM